MTPVRTILHVDMDAFFASVEQRDFPELRGKPVVIGGTADQRGVVSAASYEARKFGIHSAMPLREAHRRCAQAIFRPGRMGAYRQTSRQIFHIFEHFTPHIQPLSVDEAFLDISGALHLWGGSAEKLAQALRAEIRATCGLTASVGIAHNKFLAKLASDLEKPDGCTRVPTEEAALLAFLAPLDVERIWGVGAKTAAKLRASGWRTFGDVQRRGLAPLAVEFGPDFAAHLWALARGEDDRPVHAPPPEKSISNEHTFLENQTDPAVLRQTLLRLTEKVGRRLRAAELWADCVQIKIRSGAFETFTRQRRLDRPVRRDRELWEAALSLYERFDPPWPVRLLGVGVTQLRNDPLLPGAQLDLFEPPPEPESTGRLDETVDRIRARYGPTALRRGHWQHDDL